MALAVLGFVVLLASIAVATWYGWPPGATALTSASLFCLLAGIALTTLPPTVLNARRRGKTAPRRDATARLARFGAP